MKERIILTGGGTAGHITGNIALIPELKKEFKNIIYVGDKNGIEKEFAKRENIKFYGIDTVKFYRKKIFKNLLLPFKFHKAKKQAIKIIEETKPNVIFSKGGYVSLPICFAGKKKKIPVVTHESDTSLGLANKLISKFAYSTCCSHLECVKKVKNGILTYSPYNLKLLNGSKEKIQEKYFLDKTKKTILVVGGSLGSKNINEIISNNQKELCKTFNILHLTGKNKMNKANTNSRNYHQIEYTNNIQDFYMSADFIITRGGANTLNELLILNKPMLIIPLSKKASRGDQIINAKKYEKNNFGVCLEEENLQYNTLIEKIQVLEKNYNFFKNKMKDYVNKTNLLNANKNIIKEIKKSCKNE